MWKVPKISLQMLVKKLKVRKNYLNVYASAVTSGKVSVSLVGFFCREREPSISRLTYIYIDIITYIKL